MARRKPKLLSTEDIDKKAISIIQDEKLRWELAIAFITPHVAYRMRPLIRQLRKNFYGVFDQAIDPMTQSEKVWYPLTEINVEAVVKNIDLDQKDLQFKAKTPDGYELADVTRVAVKDKLSKIFFGEKLDRLERDLAIDGTAVWKTWEEQGKMRIEKVDLLNVYIDPTTPSIQEAYRFTERSLLFPEQIQSMNGWRNTDGIDKDIPTGVPRTDPFYMNATSMVSSNVKEIDVYECWGKIPKSLITGNPDDERKEVQGHLVVSGIDTPGKERCHLIELNARKDAEGNALKPYEECWYTRVPNRWYGRGVAEKLLMLQLYVNILFNVRINRSRVSQLGLFKIKKGSGVTPQMLSKLPANGAIVLNDINDLEQLVVQEMGQTSYTDEQNINSLAERLTNAFEVVTGEALPASTPATNAAIQSQNAKSGFSIIKDGIASFLERWMDRHALPIIAKELTAGELVRITSDEESFKDLVDKIVTNRALQALSDSFAKGYIPSPMQLQAEMQRAREQLSKGPLFMKLARRVIASEFETSFFVTNEEIDVGVTVQNLINILNVAPEYRDQIVKMTFDLLGLDMPPPQPMQQPMQQAPQPMQQPMMAPQQMQQNVTAANTI